ncbi:Cytochrome b5 reductase 4 [Entomortierella chlamydospora]|uniref:Cytochrome b5 reductase 4 n=1 Tax=Entomortierella chlamydospora TaxID=101097 RepID=A0A9P6MW80_9FUNG|nr:Cytochrome b5 reductase 4 [Entomortierella chlamydospora]KAG0016040.1 Cytochrome b5 reductase 4 [Entomortierella chlamydospora]
MSNPAITKWLEEIAAAKAKAEAKAKPITDTHIDSAVKTQQVQDFASQGKEHTTTSSGAAAAATSSTLSKSRPSYGIITSYNLETRKKQLRLVLPPEPVKPGPGECCGNDCDPCVNTLYWQDLAAYKDRVKKLEGEYEAACRALESELAGAISSMTLESADKTTTDGLDKEDEEEDETGLSIRSYRPFKVIKKRYLTETTLLVICDLPYPKPTSVVTTITSRHDDYIGVNMFHVLIRFKNDGQFLTKAFTPVDFSNIPVRRNNRSGAVIEAVEHESDGSMKGKMAFLIKLYPTPHVTSEMFRRLKEYDDVGGGLDSSQDRNGEGLGVLYLRGPIQTSRDRLKNKELVAPISTTAIPKLQQKSERIVMIAAGSGITPMYQVLRALHLQEQKDTEEVATRELDLVYCNRTSSEIWLHQEIKEICSRNRLDGLATLRSRKVRVQHVLSSEDSHKHGDMRHHHDRHDARSNEHDLVHTGGRISLKLLQDTLERNFDDQCDGSFTGTATAELPNTEHLKILICGPPSFNSDVSEMLTKLGYTNSEDCEIHILE